MRLRPTAIAVLTLLAAACNLPKRDNPHDPSVAPHAQLSFADGGPATQCLAPSAVAVDQAILDVFRGRCLALVASHSIDPRDPLSQLDFSWQLVSTSSAALGQTHGQPVLVLDGATVRALPTDTVLDVRLTVTDSSGYHSTADAPIVVHDHAPAANAIPPRTVAAGGPAWNPGGSYVLPLDATSVNDPDGDSITQLCWDRPEGTVCSLDPEDPSFVLTVPPTRGRVTAKLRASDGVVDPVVATSVVHVSNPTAWGSTSAYSTGLAGTHRIDTGRQTFPLASSNGATLAPVRNANGALGYVLTMLPSGSSLALQTASWPGFTMVGSAAVLPGTPPSASTLLVSADGSRTAVISNVSNSSITIYPYSIAGDGTLTAQTMPPSIALDTEGQTGTNPQGMIDSAGNYWLSQTWSTVVEASPAGAQLGRWSDVGSLDRVFTIRERPGAPGEVWFLRSQAPSAPAGPVTLHRILGGNETTYDLGIGHAEDFEWADSDTFWIGLDDRLALLSASALESSGAAVAEIAHADSPSAFRIMVDPGTGEAWAISLTTFEYSHVTTDGTVEQSAPLLDPNSIASFVDDAGLAWMYDSAHHLVINGETPSSDPYASTTAPGLMDFGSSDGSGGEWAFVGGIFDTQVLSHLSQLGSLETTTSVALTTAGTLAPLPTLGMMLRVAPGGAQAWMMAANYQSLAFPPPESVWTLDLSRSVPVAKLVLGTSAGVKFSTNILEPSAPVPGSTPFVWAAEGSPGAIGRMTPQGVFTAATGAGMTTNERSGIHAARSLRSNGLCTASMDGTAYRSLWIPATGSAVPLASATESSGTTVPVAAVSADTTPSSDLCWSVIQAADTATCTFGAATVVAFTPSGTLAVAYTVSPAGHVTSMKPIDRNRFWLAVTRCDANSQHVDTLDEVQNVSSTYTRVGAFAGTTAVNQFFDDEVSPPSLFFPTP